ncbi:hypothetical protein OUZ56_021265 [Daphnia magna]|uniref:Uncharacterized protein n=1 Tax=Daphnia magna TaxID=35525 RepID=A0ABQ9ZGW5_9CRUS|nr:hypothetical protein OUZ56_021265 [Daphnia magna]
MNDEETDKELENFWGLLKENQVIVPLNLKHILSTNNLVGIRVMAEINDEVIKELESSVREMGNVDIASKMSEEDKKVSKELEASFKVVNKIKDPAPTIKDRTMPTKDLEHTEGQQHTSSVANSRPKPSNEEIRALEGRLQDCIFRWGKRKNMECENQFRVAGNTVTCKFKTSASTFCNKTYKLQQSKEGSSWQISNFTNHINAEHNKTKKVSTARVQQQIKTRKNQLLFLHPTVEMKFHEKGNLLLQLLILLLGTKQMIVTVTMEVDITAHQKFLHHQMIMVTLILKKESRLHTNIEAKDPTRLLCCHRR